MLLAWFSGGGGVDGRLRYMSPGGFSTKKVILEKKFDVRADQSHSQRSCVMTPVRHEWQVKGWDVVCGISLP